MYVKVGFVAGAEQGLVIPLSAVVRRSEVVGVYIVDGDGQVGFRHVRLGSPAGRPCRCTVRSAERRAGRYHPVRATIVLKSQRAVQAADE